MDEERFDQLYNRILDGDNWDYSTLDELLCLSESDGRAKGKEEMTKKAIDAYKKACTCIGCNHCDDCDSVREFTNFLNS